MIQRPRLIITVVIVAILAIGLILDRLYPLPPLDRHYSTLVAAADGTPLRAFADDDGVWRYPITLDEVSPLYLDALLGYEDRWFYHHPGVNPIALLRASWQWLCTGEIVSGGSTLTMQVARLLDPHGRTLGGKLKQILRALQLEWHLSKSEILTLYLNLAPYGGPIEGVQAASFAYLGKPAKTLTHAEAALLAVLPQSPSRLRPDRNPQAALAARDKVLTRLATLGDWPTATVDDAKAEPVEARSLTQPMLAPLLAERLRAAAPTTMRIQTTIDYDMQWALEQMMRDRLERLPEYASLAVLVVDNRDLKVRAYLGSGDVLNDARYGHVDMVRAIRSPGSTLKPFIYGAALDDGLIHSESLLADVPTSFAGYQPSNFQGGFYGPVSVREALQRSLNVPAVDVLDRLGPERFAGILRNGGLKLELPNGDKPNLSVILGGAGTSLQSLVGAYTALARGGMSGQPRLTEQEPLVEQRMMSDGAAYIVRWMLAANPRPGMSNDVDMSVERRVAWKTGTSYGFRDSWAVGVTDRYTIGVWVGRPDGTPLPGHYGAVTAAPILFDIVDSLPAPTLWTRGFTPPSSVAQVQICWPLGTVPEVGKEHLCHERRTAWILNDAIPPTLPDRIQSSSASDLARYWVNTKTGHRVDAGCTAIHRELRETARWPSLLEPWLSPERRARSRLPRIDGSCPRTTLATERSGLKIIGVRPYAVLRRASEAEKAPMLTLSAVGGDSVSHFWLINGRLIRETAAQQNFQYSFAMPGTYDITALDPSGNYDSLSVKVIQ
ncbi:MAG: penicillin-binding protein 1C [Gammaproteobacteria bacterium]|nr:penicillin-binding protein 1C [Gammaproteobacteria bacterium]